MGRPNKNDSRYDIPPGKASETDNGNGLVRVLSDYNKAKIVIKPWGREVMLSESKQYTFKKIELKKGFETSLQYHDKKSETIFFLTGQARVVFEDANGNLVYRDMEPGSIFEVLPPAIHRVVALTDITYVEASTPDPEGIDVIRLRDGHQRKDGRIDNEHQ